MKAAASALALFLVMAAAAVFPLSRDPSRLLPDNADALHFAWSTSFVSRQLVTDPVHLFSANVFYPDRASLAYGEPMIGEALLAWPLWILSRNDAVTYNGLFLATLALGGLAAFLLARELTGDALAAFLAGEMFAFTTANYDSAARIQIVSSQWTPLALFFLVRLCRRRSPWDAAGLCLAFTLQALSCNYYGLFLATLLVLTLPALVLAQGSPRNLPWRGLLAAAALSALLIAPAALIQARTLGAISSERDARSGALPQTTYRQALPTNWLYGPTLGQASVTYDERHFLGLLPLALCAIGLAELAFRRHGQTRLLWFIVVFGLVAFVLGCGKDLPLPGVGFVPGPYRALHAFVPGYAQTRVPARFAMFVRLGVAVLAASGALALLARCGRRRTLRASLGALLAIALPLEHASMPLPTWPVPDGPTLPDVYAFLPSLGPTAAFLEFPPNPIRGRRQESLFMHLATKHWRPIVNGFSSYYPPHHDLVNEEILGGFPSVRSLRVLRALGVTHVIYHPGPQRYDESARASERFARKADRFAQDLRLVRSFDDRGRYATVLGSLGGEQVYALTPGAPRVRAGSEGRKRLALDHWTCASVPADAACGAAFDGRLETAFTTFRGQEPGDALRISFDRPTALGGVSLVCGKRALHYPRAIEVWGLAGDAWTRLATADDVDLVEFLTELLAKSPRASIDVTFAPVELTALEIRVAPEEALIQPWSQPEVELLAPE